VGKVGVITAPDLYLLFDLITLYKPNNACRMQCDRI